jgi:predicted anti-sigma-YlaC factor YlaD
LCGGGGGGLFGSVFGWVVLRACGEIRYLQRCWRVSDYRLGCVDLACVRCVIVWLIVFQMMSVVVGLVFWVEVQMLIRMLVLGG